MRTWGTERQHHLVAWRLKCLAGKARETGLLGLKEEQDGYGVQRRAFSQEKLPETPAHPQQEQ